jgi:hypothetical protein
MGEVYFGGLFFANFLGVLASDSPPIHRSMLYLANGKEL